MGVMTTTQAADRLGVSSEAVRKMLASGRLVDAGTMGRLRLVDSDSVFRCQQSPRRVGRVWSHQTAWAALSILSHEPVDWISSSEIWRLRKRLSTLDAREIPQLARQRAGVRRFRSGEKARTLLGKALALTGSSLLSDSTFASSFGLAAGEGHLDGYAKTGFIDGQVARLGLIEDLHGNIIVRESDLVAAFASGRVPIAAVAVDLCDSGSSRERAAGITKLEELLREQ